MIETIETNIPEINVDELMEKIRDEVRQRKEMGGTLRRTVPRANYAPPSNLYAKIDLSKICSLPEPEPFEYKKEGYHLNDFLKYHDKHFVTNAYRAILRRGPDSEAFEYFLKNLHSGRMTKAEILGRLRYAPEGRAKKVKIRGLFWNFVIQSSFRIPVLGYFSRLAVGIANLPLIIRNMQVLEQSALTQLENQRKGLGTLQAKENELIDVFEQLGSVLDNKAVREELEGLKGELESVLDRKIEREDLEAGLERKADHDELDQLRSEVQGFLDQKADRDLVEASLSQKADSSVVEQLEEQKANRAELKSLSRQAMDHKRNILDQQRRLTLLLEEARKRLPEPISTEQIQNMLTEEDHILDAMYVSFEDRFRGTREDIKGRLKFYLRYVQEAKEVTSNAPILDLGCGRGEWLELLQEKGYSAKGVDINRVMVAKCQEFGFDVITANAIDFLRNQPANSLSVVTGFHIIEHLPFNELLSLFDESFRGLKPDGIVIFETPNPDNILVAARNFYVDPSHVKPIPSEQLQYLIEARGFVEPEIINLHPVPDHLSHLDSSVSESVRVLFEGPQDYAIIASKS